MTFDTSDHDIREIEEIVLDEWNLHCLPEPVIEENMFAVRIVTPVGGSDGYIDLSLTHVEVVRAGPEEVIPVYASRVAEIYEEKVDGYTHPWPERT